MTTRLRLRLAILLAYMTPEAAAMLLNNMRRNATQ